MSLVLAAHLLFVNVGSAAPLLCVFLERRANRHDAPLTSHLGKQLAGAAWSALFVGVLLGCVMGGWQWIMTDDPFIRILPRFSRKIWWGVWELLFSFVCLGAYWALWNRAVRNSIGWVITHRTLAVLGTTNLLYHFPALLGVMTYVARNPGQFGDTIALDEFRRLVYSSSLASVWTHFLLASFAVSGVLLMWLADSAAGRDQGAVESRRVVRFSARVALLATVLQIFVGVWVLLETEPLQQRRLLGSDIWATALLATSVLLTFVLLHLLAAASFGDATTRDIRKIAVAVVLIVCLMTATLRRSRVERGQTSKPPVTLVRIDPTTHNATNVLVRPRRDCREVLGALAGSRAMRNCKLNLGWS